MANLELKTASGGSVTLVPEDGVSNVTATVKHESGVLASEFDAGVGRTWQDVTASRSAGVTYTNNTGRVLGVALISNTTSSVLRVQEFEVDGILVSRGRIGDATGRGGFTLYVEVPNNSTYRLSESERLEKWHELR